MLKNLRTTTEFFVPGSGLDVAAYILAGHKQGIHHLGRYQWASGVIRRRSPRRILDVACGAGYGAKMYADACPGSEVIGVDYDKRAVKWAREHYAAPNLSYRVGDMVTWSYDDGSPMQEFDAVSSFDTIEHLLHREIALIQLAEHVAVDGVLLFSTPCGHGVTRLNPEWEHHKIEYSHVDLRNLMQRFFGTILAPDDGTLPDLSFWTDVINAGTPRYLNRFNPIACLDPIRKRGR